MKVLCLHLCLYVPFSLRGVFGQSSTVELCRNDSEYVHESNPIASCRWIRWEENRRHQYCQYEQVHNFCPQTCGDCCEDYSNYEFKNNSNEVVHCDWLQINKEKTKERKQKYCNGFWYNGYTVRDACSRSCDFCKQHIPALPFDQQSNVHFIVPSKKESESSYLLITAATFSGIFVLGCIIAYVYRGSSVSEKKEFSNDSTSADSIKSYTFKGGKDSSIFKYEIDHQKIVESNQKILERQIGVNSTIEMPLTPTSSIAYRDEAFISDFSGYSGYSSEGTDIVNCLEPNHDSNYSLPQALVAPDESLEKNAIVHNADNLSHESSDVDCHICAQLTLKVKEESNFHQSFNHQEVVSRKKQHEKVLIPREVYFRKLRVNRDALIGYQMRNTSSLSDKCDSIP